MTAKIKDELSLAYADFLKYVIFYIFKNHADL